MGVLLRAEELTKEFAVGGRRRGSIRAVDGVSFSLAEGETFGLVGESGSGKSTTARLLMRLLPVTAGKIVFEEIDITHAGRGALAPYRRDVQMIFQDPYSSLNPRRTIGAIIGQPLRHAKLVHGKEDLVHEVQGLMERVGLNPEHYNRYPHDFSGGQRQRIGIARALASGPRLIIADEPVSALDVSIQAQILNLLTELKRDLGLTMLFIAHDLSVVRHMCDRVAVMYMGQIVETAARRSLFDRPEHPYTAGLLDAIPIPDPDHQRARHVAAIRDETGLGEHPLAGCRFYPRCPRATDRCVSVMPTLEPNSSGGAIRCHHPLEGKGAESK
jgi:oligopeptide/dipeptide ABC transporter ATP-binding protein